MPTKKAESEKKKNTLSVRLADAQHDLITDTAWRRKTNCSQMIRDIVLEQLQREVKQSQTV